jgi:hypothetical protein
MSLREVAEGHRTGEGDMNCMMCFPRLNSYKEKFFYWKLIKIEEF